jgi:hypothetical protein
MNCIQSSFLFVGAFVLWIGAKALVLDLEGEAVVGLKLMLGTFV